MPCHATGTVHDRLKKPTERTSIAGCTDTRTRFRIRDGDKEMVHAVHGVEGQLRYDLGSFAIALDGSLH